MAFVVAGLAARVALGLFGPVSGAFAAGADAGNAQTASSSGAEQLTLTRSQWDLQIERKWTSGRTFTHPASRPSSMEEETAPTLGSAASSPGFVETSESNKSPSEALREYISANERPPDVSRVTRLAKVEDPNIDPAVVATTPIVSEASSEPLEHGVLEDLTSDSHFMARSNSSPARGASVVVGEARSFAAPVPDIVVTQTVWHPHVVRRRAWVEVSGGVATELSHGSRVGSFSVAAIESGSVVFRHEGVERRNPIGLGR